MPRLYFGLGARPAKSENFPTIPVGYVAAGICLGVAISFGIVSLSNSQLHGDIATEARIESGETLRGPLPVIDTAGAAALMKSTIMAVQHANQTGNYSVLRDLGTPAFRESFDQARLTSIFAPIRALGADLGTLVLSMPPSPGGVPEFGANRLRLSGEFMARSLRIRYDLTFVPIGGRWRIAGLGIDTTAVTESPGLRSPLPPAAEVIAPALSTHTAFPS
jgi:hypothetical protein